MEHVFQIDEHFARSLDAQDPLAKFGAEFYVPTRADGRPVIYLCGNSLGLQPKATAPALQQELSDWATLAVDAHFEGKHPWYPYHEELRQAGAELVGALPHEVVFMNSLTANLHFMMVSFYRPTQKRFKILIDAPTFPSDLYAVQSQVRFHGYDPRNGVITVHPEPGQHTLATEQIERVLAERGEEIALVLLSGVNYLTGQAYDIPRIVAAAHRAGALIGVDLAHAAGNLQLNLHDDNVDFAAWCSYKYLNGGPGAVAGCYVHERHATNTSLVRFAGWWGNDPATRFQMDLRDEFVPQPCADAWQLSNPPILAMAPVRESLNIFQAAGGMAALRRKSERLTGYLAFLLGEVPANRLQVITPNVVAERGCQLSLLVLGDARRLHEQLTGGGIVCDFRPPNVIRMAPVPLYNSYIDVWRAADVVKKVLCP